MIELRGAYTDCKIFTEDVASSALDQVQLFLNHPAFEGCKTRFMPDIHAGSGSVIGVDIGCGMLSCKLDRKAIGFESLDTFVREFIPSGFKVNTRSPEIPDDFKERLLSVCSDISLSSERVLLSLGTLGGGNHFIEIGEDEESNLWLTIHSGSRNFGLQVATYHQKEAENLCSTTRIDLTNIPLKDRESFKLEQKLSMEEIPKGMEYLTGNSANRYIGHMKVAQEYASLNRRIIMDKIVSFLHCDILDTVESIHNYIDFDFGIIRKGAISANLGELVVIPWNMRDGLIIGRGKGNPDWNFSAPYGAGRTMSRTRAKELLDLETFKQSMESVYSSCISESTLDEAPAAYKDYLSVERYMEDSVEILYRVRPLYNFKA